MSVDGQDHRVRRTDAGESYRIGLAESPDGVHWIRRGNGFGKSGFGYAVLR